MARYAKIGVQMWSDSRFRALSRPKPSARELWVYLLTNPAKTALPGILHVGEATLAEGLDWPVSAVRRHWKEIEAQGMAKADWRARLVWVPKMPKWDPPNGPNVAKAWGRVLVQMPECELRAEVVISVDVFLDGISPYLRDAFRDGIGKALPNAVRISDSRQPTTDSRLPQPSPTPSAAGAPDRGDRNGNGAPPDLWDEIHARLRRVASPRSRALLAGVRSLGESEGRLTLAVPGEEALRLLNSDVVRAEIDYDLRELRPDVATEVRFEVQG